MISNAYTKYKKQSITTLTPIEIVIKLYDECERQMNRALHFLEKKDYENTNAAMMKALDVVGALRSVLDLDIPIGANLDKLYDYFARELLSANMKKDVAQIRKLIPMLGELREAFSQISRMSREQINMQAIQNASGAGVQQVQVV